MTSNNLNTVLIFFGDINSVSMEIHGDIPAAHERYIVFFLVYNVASLDLSHAYQSSRPLIYSLASLGVEPGPGVNFDRFMHTVQIL